jgi:hypothetical protein
MPFEHFEQRMLFEHLKHMKPFEQFEQKMLFERLKHKKL